MVIGDTELGQLVLDALETREHSKEDYYALNHLSALDIEWIGKNLRGSLRTLGVKLEKGDTENAE